MQNVLLLSINGEHVFWYSDILHHLKFHRVSDAEILSRIYHCFNNVTRTSCGNKVLEILPREFLCRVARRATRRTRRNFSRYREQDMK